jgi:hypothetical protein
MKTKRYWLRGGVVGLIIGITVSPFSLFGFYFPIVTPISQIMTSPLNILFGSNVSLGGIPILFAIYSVLWIIYGIIIGWIYGKIKGKNSLVQ